jgi:glucose-6-phosphate isomerase
VPLQARGVTRETQQLPIDVAHTAPREQHCDAMFCGVHINTSENSAVRHTALGESRSVPIIHGQNGVEYGHAVRDAMDSFTDRPTARRRIDGHHRRARQDRDH